MRFSEWRARARLSAAQHFWDNAEPPDDHIEEEARAAEESRADYLIEAALCERERDACS